MAIKAYKVQQLKLQILEYLEDMILLIVLMKRNDSIASPSLLLPDLQNLQNLTL